MLSPLFFFSDLNNYITFYGADRLHSIVGITSKTAQSYANVDAHQWGGELTGTATLTAKLQMYGSVAYARGTKVPQPQNNIRSSNLFQVPPLKAALNVQYEHRLLLFGGSRVFLQDGKTTSIRTRTSKLPLVIRYSI